MRILPNISREGPRLSNSPAGYSDKFTPQFRPLLASNGNTYTISKKKWLPGQIIQLLGSIKKSVDQLKAELKHKDDKVRRKALNQIHNLQAQCMAALKFRHPDSSTRVSAARMLRKIGGTAALKILSETIHGINKDPEAQVREAAVYALGSIIQGKSIDALLGALNDINEDVRYAAVQMTVEFKSFKDKRIIAALIKKISIPTKDTCPLVRREAAYVLRKFQDHRAIPALNSALTDNDAIVRQIAARALGQLKNKSSINPLIALLIGPKRDTCAEVRKDAVAALGEIGGPKATAVLIKLISGPSRDPDSGVRVGVVWALSTTKDRRCIPALTKALTDPFPLVRQSAAEILRRLRQK